jgi:hypothetical protein
VTVELNETCDGHALFFEQALSRDVQMPFFQRVSHYAHGSSAHLGGFVEGFFLYIKRDGIGKHLLCNEFPFFFFSFGFDFPLDDFPGLLITPPIVLFN